MVVRLSRGGGFTRAATFEGQLVTHKISKCAQRWCIVSGVSSSDIKWLSTAEAARQLGVTPRTLYRFIDEGQLAAYRFGRVIRLKDDEVSAFIESCRIEPGTLEHLYPEAVVAKD